jgi:hypothetical protein
VGQFRRRFTTRKANAGPDNFNAAAGAALADKDAVSMVIASAPEVPIAAADALVAPLSVALLGEPAVRRSERTNAHLALIAPVAVSATGAASANVPHPSLIHALLQNVQMG